MSRFATSNWGGRRKRSLAFAEHGAIQAATIQQPSRERNECLRGRAEYLCAKPPNTRMDEPKRLPYNITNRKNRCKPIWRSQQLPVKVRRLSPKRCGPLRISSPATEFISRFLMTARLLYV